MKLIQKAFSPQYASLIASASLVAAGIVCWNLNSIFNFTLAFAILILRKQNQIIHRQTDIINALIQDKITTMQSIIDTYPDAVEIFESSKFNVEIVRSEETL